MKLLLVRLKAKYQQLYRVQLNRFCPFQSTVTEEFNFLNKW